MIINIITTTITTSTTLLTLAAPAPTTITTAAHERAKHERRPPEPHGRPWREARGGLALPPRHLYSHPTGTKGA